MSMGSPNGVLDITNTTVRVSKIESDEVIATNTTDSTKARVAGGTGGDIYVDSNWQGSGNTGDIIFREAGSEKARITGSGKFQVEGDQTVQEYPPQAMTGWETYMEGHGVFRASASSTFGTYYVYRIFNKANPVGGNSGVSAGWASQGPSTETDTYNATTGLEALSTTHHTNSAQGEWVQFETSHPIKLKTLDIHSRAETSYVDNMTGFPKGVYLYGSNDNAHWSLIKNFTTVSKTAGASHLETIDATEAYKHYAFVVNSIHVSGTDVGWTSIGQLYFNGTPAPSSLEDGHLTLGKALTAPRFSGHAAGAETPRAESLLVHYDTTVDSVFSGTTAVDTSGSDNNGKLSGVAYSSSDRAFIFDGVDDYLAVDLPTELEGDPTFTMSIWVNPITLATAQSNYDTFVHIGENSASAQVQLSYYGYDYHLALGGYNQGMLSNDADAAPVGQWTHLCAVVQSGAWSTTTKKLYINGELYSLTLSGSGTTNIPAGDSASKLVLGAVVSTNGSYNHFSNTKLSNFKLWGVALTADEVAAEYALGRTGKALNVTDTAVCIGGTVPRAQLDVRGTLHAPGVILKTSQYIDYTSRSTTSEGLQDGYNTPWTAMKAGSKIRLHFYIPWRNDGTGWGGCYHVIQIRVNKELQGLAANTWVSLVNSGHYMTYYQDIISYANSIYIPVGLNEDYEVQFRHLYRRYNTGTLYITGSSSLGAYYSNEATKFGLSSPHGGALKFIIDEIAG